MQTLTFTSALMWAISSLLNSVEVLPEASKTNADNFPTAQINFEQPKPPPDSPQEDAEQGTGSRGDCPIASSNSDVQLSLLPLIPKENWGTTLSESPTLWVYVSYSNGEVEVPISAEVSVQNRETNRSLLPRNMTLTLPQKSGVFKIELPHSLETNEWYRWYLVVNCNPQSSPTPSILSIEGLIYRTELPNGSNVDTMNIEDKFRFSVENNFWYDTLTNSASLYCGNPQSLEHSQNLNSLLTFGEFNAITPELFICDE